MAMYRAKDGWKGAITLNNPTDHFIVYLADDRHYMIIYGNGRFETKDRKS